MARPRKTDVSQVKLTLTMGLIPVILYVRVSSDEQKEGFSIPAQIDLLVDYARKNNMRIVRIFEESMSAKDSGRVEFNRMLKYLQTHRDVKTILVEKTDRLYRNFKDYALLDDNKFDIHLVKEGEVLNKDSTSHQKLVHGLKVLLAKNFIDNLREETYKGRKKKAEEGYLVAAVPYGYKKKDPRTVLSVPEQKLFVQKCFEYYETEGSLNAAKERLTRENIIYRENQPVVSRGQLHRILRTITYTGVIEFEGNVHDAKHEAFITKETFDRVQKLLRKERGYVHDYLFPGVMRCERCGAMMTAEVVKGNYIYYHCGGGNRNCKQKHIHIREEFIENQFTRAIEKIQMTTEQRDFIAKRLKSLVKDVKYINTDQRDSIMVEANKIQQFMGKLYDDKLAGNITEEFWKMKNDEYQKKLDDTTEQLKTLSVTNTSSYEECIQYLNDINMLIEMWHKGGFQVKQKIAKLVFKRITVKGRICKFTYAMPFSYFVDSDYRDRAGRIVRKKKVQEEILELKLDEE